MDSGVADLKAQFEKAVAHWHRRGDAASSVRVEHPAEDQWLFWLHNLKSVECRLDPPKSLWLAKKHILAKAADLCFVGARYRGEDLLVLVELKITGTPAAAGPMKSDDFLLAGFSTTSNLFADPVRNVAAKRSWRALSRIFQDATTESVEDVASQNSDLAVLVRALEQPEALATLSEDDPFAAARLRGVQERERLLTEEGGTWTAAQVARHLRLTRQSINLRRKQGLLLGLDAGRHGFRYPAWQFGSTGTIVGLHEVLSSLKHLDSWMQQAFMLGRSTRLKGRRPIDVLRSDDISAVVKVAAASGEHGAA